MNDVARTSSSAILPGPFAPGSIDAIAAADLYLDLLKKCLTRVIFDERGYVPVTSARGSWRERLYQPIRQLLGKKGIVLARKYPFDLAAREGGRDWPSEGETMIGLRRLDNLQFCIADVLRSNVPGDMIETGVWRGGACIFMCGALKAYGDHSRNVWVADSFEGLPPPNKATYPADARDEHWTATRLAVSLDEVKSNFARYNLLGERVRFLKGWFKDTLASAPIETLSLLRLDGDMYESTMDSLVALYPKVSVGGYTVIDDYGDLPACKAAVHDYRERNAIHETIVPIDVSGVYWKRERR